MKRACSHCHLQYEEENLFKTNINGKDEYFCCRGCENVFRILLDSNLLNFYDKLGETPLEPPKDYNDNLAKFDSESFRAKYITESNGYSQISLILEGIHCIACIWLNQKILTNNDGILKVDINYTNNKAKILYDEKLIKPSGIIKLIRSIGYDAQAYDPKTLEQINAKERKSYYIRMTIGIFCSMNIMWIAIAQYSGYFLGMDRGIKDILNFASFLLATPALFYSGSIFFKSGYYGLKNGFINMDLLVSFGSTLTYIYSIYAALTHSGETYFESVTMIITFILIGKFLEKKSKKNAGDSIDKLSSSIPSSLNVISDDKIISLTPQEVKVGDIIELKPGEKIIIDGKLLSQKALIDNSMLTGESAFENKVTNDILLSGGINLNYTIRYQAIKCFEDSTINNIITLLQDSINQKPNIQTKANAISYHFSAFILLIAAITFILWAFLYGDYEKAMVVAVSVIIIACPCALALATPIATIIGISEAYKNRLLFKEAKFLETMAKSNAVIFDKTGTLTFGKPKVINEIVLKEFDRSLLYSFLRLNTHPISNGIREYLGEQKIIELNDFKQINQKGIIATHKDSTIIGGSRSFLEEYGIKVEDSNDDCNMKFYYAIDKQLVGIFNLKDKLKDSAKEIITTFKNEGFRVVMLSGDRLEVVKNIADTLNIDEYYAKQSPIDKSNFIDSLHKDEYKCIMVGDGINDAIALNKSDIAISMGQGSDIAIESSDIVLLDDKLESLLLAYNLSKKTYKTIKQNIKISIVYNLLTIPLAACGFIIPLFAAISMSFSSLLVVLNSLRIKSKN